MQDRIRRRRRKARKNRIIKIAVAVLVIAVVAVAVFFAVRGISGYIKAKQVPPMAFEFSQDAKTVASVEPVVEYNKNFGIGIKYPHVDDEAMMKVIKKDADAIVEGIRGELAGYTAENADARIKYTIDYDAYAQGDKYLSVIYHVNGTSPKTMEKDERIGTRNYDLKAGKGIASEELFNDDFLKEMSEYTTSYFKSNDKYKAMVSTAQFAKGIEPNWVNFKNLCYKSADTLTVYFSSNTLFPASYGPTSMEVPLKNKKVYDAIKINMTGYERPKSMVDPTKPMIALSFDDGPYEPVTARILNALEKVGGRATFFVLGERLNESEKSREVMKRAYDMGCEIGNHSYDHADLARISVPKMQEQISKTNDLIKATIGQPGTLVRAPYGSINATVRSSVGGPLVNWSIDTLDWKTKNPSKIIPEVLEHVTDGDITLMHDIYKTSAEAAETIIPELARRGYQLVTISELMEAREVAMVSGKTYSQAYAKKAAE